MPITDFPVSLQPIIQEGMLEREILDGLESNLGFRSIADREEFSTGIGETITKTRKGCKKPVTTPMSAVSNTGLDNGLTPSGWAVEQYTLALEQYGDTIDLNTVTSGVGITKQFVKNARTNSVQAFQSLDRLAGLALMGAYMGGNTEVRTTLGAPAATIAVDDVRGFEWVPKDGKQKDISPSNSMVVVVDDNAYTLVGVARDVTNVSKAKALGGVSGTLTFSGNVSVDDGTAGKALVSSIAPSVRRAGDKKVVSAIVAADKLTAKMIQDGVADLRSNNVPDINGAYNLFLTARQELGLYRDPEFQMLYRGRYESDEYKSGNVTELLGARLIKTTEITPQMVNGVPVWRAFLCGQGALVEGDYAETGVQELGSSDAGLVTVSEGIAFVTREPLDRLKQIVSQSWYSIVGFAVPTDVTVDKDIIPTSTNSAFKRCVVLESA